jgi:hypothetical protein
VQRGLCCGFASSDSFPSFANSLALTTQPNNHLDNDARRAEKRKYNLFIFRRCGRFNNCYWTVQSREIGRKRQKGSVALGLHRRRLERAQSRRLGRHNFVIGFALDALRANRIPNVLWGNGAHLVLSFQQRQHVNVGESMRRQRRSRLLHLFINKTDKKIAPYLLDARRKAANATLSVRSKQVRRVLNCAPGLWQIQKHRIDAIRQIAPTDQRQHTCTRHNDRTVQAGTPLRTRRHG